ncbi:hypothetical protein AZE42_11587 [Rhizopogon vesiculosus]|uniref:Uncharacterized protein n=1 Tax=Rhizopogon vesiculosus TaxID=180088 RepID=A0A1J8Q0P0_9AGAM|nr:hypothetical protein AZE42_11587 [Rhizopogon vesiculosus]
MSKDTHNRSLISSSSSVCSG